MELSGDLLTDSFILSLRRFLARRGRVNIMQSDNGANFIVAVKEINDAIKNLKHVKIITYLNKHQIKWQFNPLPRPPLAPPLPPLAPPPRPSPRPLSSWIGGCWESLIKTIKRSLYAILKNSITTDNNC